MAVTYLKSLKWD